MIKLNLNIACAVALAACVGLTGCDKNPIDKLINTTDDNAVAPGSTSTYTIYGDELRTSGGLGFVPAATNQSINLQDSTASRRTMAHIRYEWNGQPVSAQHLFAGFSLLVTEDFSSLATANAKDLSGAGYTKMSLWIRGDVSTAYSLRIEGPDDGVEDVMDPPARAEISREQLNSGWTEVSFDVPAEDFAAVKVFATFTLQYDQPPRTTNPGNGGIIYLDDIRYVQ